MADELMRDLPGDLPTFLARFGTDAQCRAYPTHGRWPEGFCCAGCGHGRAYSHRVRLIEECAACGKQHSLLAGTMFEQTKTGLARWFLAIWLVTSSKGGISAVELQGRWASAAIRPPGPGCTRSARRWSGQAAGRSPRVEADETLVGGAKPGKRGRGAAGKTVVAGAVEAGRGKGRGRRLGRLRLQAVADASAESFWKISSPATWHRPPQSPPTAGRAMPGWARPATTTRRSTSPPAGATRCCACPRSISSSASPSGGCSARTMARSAGNPPGLSRRVRLPLVWGFGCQALNVGIVFLPVSSSSRWRQPSRGLAHDVPRGARPLARIIAPQACIRRTRGDPDHDAAMRIGGEAPGRRAHSSTRHESHRKARVTATSDRHRQPAGEPWAGRETVSGVPLRPSPLTPPDGGRHRPASRRWSPNATAR